MTIEQSCDIELLSKLFKKLMEDEHSDNYKNDEQLYANMKKYIESTDSAFVFNEDGRLVGYALVTMDREPLYLRHFYICRNERRKGYGTQAFDADR